MKMSIGQKILIFGFIILAGNGIVVYAVYNNNQKRISSEEGVRHSMDVISKLGYINSLSKDIESASRGFVITNDSIFLRPLLVAKEIIFLNIGQLRKLLQDNPQQQERLDSIKFYVQDRLDFSEQQIEIRQKQGLASAVEFATTKRGLYYSNQVREFTEKLQQEEYNRLEERRLIDKQSELALNRILGIMFVFLSVITIFLLIMAGKYLAQIKNKEKRTAELNLANTELAIKNEENKIQEAANKELEAFSYSVSHDLRAPLRHIGGFVDLLIKNNSAQLDDAGKRYLNIISESSSEMGNLIDALLTFSRLSRAELQHKKINSKNMVTQVIESFSDEIVGRNVEINVSDLPNIRGDETLIKQVWINLISNALKYSKNKERAVINIGGTVEKDKLIFYVKDNGVGFDMEYADKLFGVFQRLHKVKDFEGIGIGLANVNRIVVRHGGMCRAESKVDKGATFFFSLPNN